jgi:hypothetical protein
MKGGLNMDFIVDTFFVGLSFGAGFILIGIAFLILAMALYLAYLGAQEYNDKLIKLFYEERGRLPDKKELKEFSNKRGNEISI